MQEIELLALSLFWPLMAAMFLVMAFTSDEDKPGWATLTFAGTLVLAWFAKKVDFLDLITHQGLYVAVGLAVYVAIGVVYHLVRWKFFCKAVAHAYDDLKEGFLRSNKVEIGSSVRDTVIPQGLHDAWKSRLKNGAHYSALRHAYGHNPTFGTAEFAWPNRTNQKSRLITWMAFWPTSVVWWLISDPIMGLFRNIYRSLASTYDRISNGEFAHTKADLAPPPPPAAPPDSSDGGGPEVTELDGATGENGGSKLHRNARGRHRIPGSGRADDRNYNFDNDT